MNVLSIGEEDVPEDLREELKRVVDKYGRVDVSKLRPDLRERVEEFITSRGTETELIEMVVKKLDFVVEGLVDGLRIYNKHSRGLLVTFHDADAKRKGLELYNACANFVRDWNEMELEHGECVDLNEEIRHKH